MVDEPKVIADEETGVIRCTECGETMQSKRYTGSLFNLMDLTKDLDTMVYIHAARHQWKKPA